MISVAPDLEARVHISASPERVWEVVSDVRRMGEWSPECRRVFVWGGDRVSHGSWFTAINRRRWAVWPTTSNVELYEPGRAIGWHTRDSGAHWSFRLEPDDGGTLVVQRRELPQGITLAGRILASTLLGGVEEHSEELREGMGTTLARIKAEAERAERA